MNSPAADGSALTCTADAVAVASGDPIYLDPLSPMTLRLDIPAFALSHFMQTYAVSSPFDYLPEYYQSLLKSDENLALALEAPALALLAHDLRQPGLLRLAYSKYPVALAGTQKALASPDLATLDSTLVSVLLLTLYEALVFRGRHSPKSWHAHVQGSAALLQLRGEKQFDSPLGWPLFSHASGNIRTSCVFLGVRVPLALEELSGQAASLPASNYRVIRLGYVLDELSVLRCSESSIPVSERVMRTYELDNELIAIMTYLAHTSPVSEMRASDIPQPVYAYKNRATYHTSHKEAKQWNTIRTVRLILAQYIWAALKCEAVDSSVTLDMQECPNEKWQWLRETMVDRAEEAISGILYSVPYSLELSQVPRASANWLIFPLSAIAVSRLAPVSAKMYARNRLRFISTEYDLGQALESVKVAMEGGHLEDWYVISLDLLKNEVS